MKAPNIGLQRTTVGGLAAEAGSFGLRLIKRLAFPLALFVWVSFKVSAAEPAPQPPCIGWQKFFANLAQHNVDLGVNPTDPESVAALTAESQVDPHFAGGTYILVTPHLFTWVDRRPVDQLRGAQGNGEMYLLRRQACGFIVLGAMGGNSCKYTPKLQEGIRTERFTCRSHISAASFGETEYELVGDALKVVSSRVVK